MMERIEWLEWLESLDDIDFELHGESFAAGFTMACNRVCGPAADDALETWMNMGRQMFDKLFEPDA